MKEEEKLSKLLYIIDNGRFKKLMTALEPNDICFKCSYFNHTLPKSPDNKYRCNVVSPRCIGGTLRSELISYLLWKTGIKTEKEHQNFLGL